MDERKVTPNFGEAERQPGISVEENPQQEANIFHEKFEPELWRVKKCIDNVREMHPSLQQRLQDVDNEFKAVGVTVTVFAEVLDTVNISQPKLMKMKFSLTGVRTDIDFCSNQLDIGESKLNEIIEALNNEQWNFPSAGVGDIFSNFIKLVCSTPESSEANGSRAKKQRKSLEADLDEFKKELEDLKNSLGVTKKQYDALISIVSNLLKVKKGVQEKPPSPTKVTLRESEVHVLVDAQNIVQNEKEAKIESPSGFQTEVQASSKNPDRQVDDNTKSDF